MALKVLKSADHSGLYTVFGEQSGNHQQLLETGRKTVCSLVLLQAKAWFLPGMRSTPKGQERKIFRNPASGVLKVNGTTCYMSS